MPHHLRAPHPAEGTQGCQQIDGFQNIGFALGILPQQHLKSWRKIGFQPRIIAEVTQSKVGQMHREKMKWIPIHREFFLPRGQPLRREKRLK